MNLIITNIINEINLTGKDLFTKKEILEMLEEHTNPTRFPMVESRGIKVDPSTFTVIQGEESIYLPRREFQLLYLLIENSNKNLSREKILRYVWGDDSEVGERTIDVHILKIRQRFPTAKIKTNRGVGYKWIEDEC